MAKVLSNVEFKVSVNADELSVEAPFWRTDIEIPEDIVEEVGRLKGFDSLPQVLPSRSIRAVPHDPMLSLKQQTRLLLSRGGANELLTYSFAHGDLLDKASQDKKNAYQLVNALSPSLQYYRLSLLPSLLEKVHPNIKAGYPDFALFEINPVHSKTSLEENGELPTEDQRVAFVFAADNKTAKSRYQGASYYQALQYMTYLLVELGVPFKIAPVSDVSSIAIDDKTLVAPFEPSRLAVVQTTGGKSIGYIGEFNQKISKGLKLPDFVAGFELSLSKLVDQTSSKANYKKMSKYPAVEQDICFKVDVSVSYQSVLDLVFTEFGKIGDGVGLEVIKPLDIFQRPEDLEHKQITFRLSVVNEARTMTDAEVNIMLDKVAVVAKDKLNAERI